MQAVEVQEVTVEPPPPVAPEEVSQGLKPPTVEPPTRAAPEAPKAAAA
jgi:hypothetical protein